MKLSSHVARVAPAISLLAALTGCSASAPVEGASSSSAASTAATASPYVKLRWATAQTTTLPGQGYTHVALAATGLVEVANVAYDKQVVVRYQGDGDWADANATYVGPAGADHELWAFTTGARTYLPYFGAAELPFAIAYTVAGATAWDNNGGANYTVGGAGGGGVLVSPVALGQDALKVADSALTSASGAVTFAGHVTLKNLAYEKDITVVYTTDGWKTVLRTKGAYQYTLVGSGSTNALELWSFSESVPAATKSVQFAIEYAVNGATYWDNDLGANYTASLQ